MIFKGGQKVDMVVGAVPKTTLASTLEKLLEKDNSSAEKQVKKDHPNS